MVDRASNFKGFGVGVFCKTPDDEIIEQSFCLGFDSSNNEAEYEALIARLRLAMALGARRLRIYSDSQLVVNQVLGEHTTKDARMEAYLNVVCSLVQHFEEYLVQQVSRDLNTQVDALASFGSTSEPNLHRSISVGFIEEPNIQIEATITADKVKEDWQMPIVTFEGEIATRR